MVTPAPAPAPAPVRSRRVELPPWRAACIALARAPKALGFVRRGPLWVPPELRALTTEEVLPAFAGVRDLGLLRPATPPFESAPGRVLLAQGATWGTFARNRWSVTGDVWCVRVRWLDAVARGGGRSFGANRLSVSLDALGAGAQEILTATEAVGGEDAVMELLSATWDEVGPRVVAEVRKRVGRGCITAEIRRFSPDYRAALAAASIIAPAT